MAASQTPTPDQLEIFRNLTPEQQQAILERTGAQSGANDSSADTRPNADINDQRRRAAAAADQKLQTQVLGADDTVVIEVSLPRDGPAPTVPTEPVTQQRSPTPAEAAATLRRQRMVAELDSEGRKKLEDLIRLVLLGNPYTLDRNGQLNLPGFAPIALGGLIDEQATQRLSLEPVLLPVEVHISRLPLAKTGAARLKPFGYDLFDNPPSTFSPVTNVPVPADYIVGPGDQLKVQLFGNQNRSLSLPVNRDGTINFPELGPIRVGGMSFNAARQTIESRVAQQMIGVRASVSMGDMGTIRMFVAGEAKVPGSYTVSGLATMTTALVASGGVKPIGSLRNIQLKRGGKVVRTLDLYDLLIRGDLSDDAKVLPGDVIFIPPVGNTVSVDGEVKRPAIYELRDEMTVADVVRIAGGYTTEADAARTSLTRVDGGRRMVIDVNLDQPSGNAQNVRNGDVLRIATLRPQLDAGVMLEGHVHRPGAFAWRQGMHLTDVIASVDELKPNADQHYVLIRRESGPDRRVSVFSADLTAALAAPGSTANVPLESRDRITVFDLAPGRERIIQPLVQELRLQSNLDRPTELVRVEGSVRIPGEYPLEPGMRISDLLRAGGNLRPSAFGGTAELARYALSNDGARRTELITIDLAAAGRGEASANLLLRPYDSLLVKETPDWADQESVTLRGEVRFPGTYPIRKGETLHALLERAGGLTSTAFPEGSAFTRQELKTLEQEQLDRLSARMRTDLATLALRAANAGESEASQALAAGQNLLQQLQGSRAVGRFVIDLPDLLAAPTGSDKDVVLRNGDELFIPKLRQEVTVIGEVQSAGSYLFRGNYTLNDYVAMSGGKTRKADGGQIYVVRANGSSQTREGAKSWFSRNFDVAIKPGDTIVVPLDTERMPRLRLWQAVTQILYNVAVSVAAVNSF
ncbi:MAG: SLBB domain-containing protein [Pseudomonadota bacterium]